MLLWVIGGDARSRYAAQYLQAQGYCVQTHGVPETADTPLPTAISHAVLPFPSFADTLLRGRSAIPTEEILCRTQEHSQIFGGLFGTWRDAFLARGATVHDLYGTEPLTTANAVPTAEGAIALAIEHSSITLHGANCLVCGFGRCGKVLAQKLQALHANITVSARKTSDLALAQTQGFSVDESAVWRHGLQQYDFIFNTVPSPLFTEEQLQTLSSDCIIIELASKPGAIPSSAQSHLHYHFAPGLPGKFAPKTAGILYAQSIIKQLESEGFH